MTQGGRAQERQLRGTWRYVWGTGACSVLEDISDGGMVWLSEHATPRGQRPAR